MLQFHAIPDDVRELLKEIMPWAAERGFALAGGTSLALRFGHRLSVDLDFFTTELMNFERLGAEFPVPAVEVARSRGALSLVARSTKVDFLRHDYPQLDASEEEEGIVLMSVKDVAAMKLNAICNRGAKKDFYDIVELWSYLDLPSMLEAFESKYVNVDRFVALRSLAWFDDAESEPDPVSLRGLGWADVKQRVAETIRRV